MSDLVLGGVTNDSRSRVDDNLNPSDLLAAVQANTGLLATGPLLSVVPRENDVIQCARTDFSRPKAAKDERDERGGR